MANHEVFREVSTRFLAFLESKGATISDKVELVDLRHRNAGRGMVAKENLDEDIEIFSIPKSLILSVKTSSLPLTLQKRLIDPWYSLILAMVCEHRHGTSSTWKPYLDVLPFHFDTLMFWSSEELEHLQGSVIVEKIGKETADAKFTSQLLPLIRQYADSFDVSDSINDDELLKLCHRMGSTIMAYAFDLEPDASPSDETVDGVDEYGWEIDTDAANAFHKGMIPLADMLNANASRNNVKLFHEDDRVVMRTIKFVEGGEELFNDYGPLPTADVLRRYGYVTEEYSPYDVVEVSLATIRDAAAQHSGMEEKEIQSRLDYLDDQGLLEDGYDIGRAANEAEQFPEELAILLNMLVATREEVEKWQKRGKVPKPSFAPDALSLLWEVLLRRRAMYPSHPSPDSPRAVHASASSHRRIAMARQVIAGEKVVLQEAAQKCSELQGSLSKRKSDDFEEQAVAHAVETTKRIKTG